MSGAASVPFAAMVTGVPPGVLRLGSPDQLPLPPPPGVVVVASDDPVRTAQALVVALGTEGCLAPVEARGEIERRRQADLRSPRQRARRCREEAVAAMAEADEARSLLSPAAATRRPDIVRRAAASITRAAQEVEAAGTDLGPRPPLDDEAARAAHAADRELAATRRDRYSRLPQANSLLFVANGAAGVLVVGRLLSDAFDPAFFLVALLPLGALGFAAGTVLANVRRCRAAARRRWTALRSLDVSTMSALTAREERCTAWAQRKARLLAAESYLARAQEAWRSLVGDGVAVTEAGRLVGQLEALAVLEARSASAQSASTEAAVALQEAEDLAGSGHAPIVVLDTRPATRRATRRRAVDDLARSAGTARVVVVERAASDRSPSSRAPAEEGGAIVDVRGRLLAGLQRLRMKPAPPDSVAASG